MTAAPEQLTLDLAEFVEPEYEPTMTPRERFEAFHAANPHIADALEHLAEEWLAAGNRRVGLRALWERLRWEVGVQTSGDGDYALNNDWPPFYARLLVARRPEWDDAIRRRRAQADES